MTQRKCLHWFTIIFSVFLFLHPTQALGSTQTLEERLKESSNFYKHSHGNFRQVVMEIAGRGLLDPNKQVVLNYLYGLQRIGRSAGLRYPEIANSKTIVTTPESLKVTLKQLMLAENVNVAS